MCQLYTKSDKLSPYYWWTRNCLPNNHVYPIINIMIEITKISGRVIYIFCYFYCYFYLVESFHPSRNLDEVFTYNHIWL